MENKKQWILSVLWMLAAVITRILYFLFNSRAVVDTYGYYAHALNGPEEAPVLTSGMAHAYTNHLSGILPYLKNGMESIGIYHLILQIVWMVFLIAGMGILFGKIAQFLTGGILMLAPGVSETMFVVSPENYLMFWLSLLFLAFAVFFYLTKKRGWYRSSFGELYLMLTGFWTGVVCIWNYSGWLLLPVIVYILNKNRYNLKDKIWEQKQKEIYLERQQVMRVSSQISILAVGILLGMYATLMKYTGMTGAFVGEQFQWWILQYKELPNRCQDISTELILWLLFAGVVGVLSGMLVRSVQKRKLQNMMYEDEEYLPDEEPVMESKTSRKEAKKEAEYVVTQDGRKVELLDNPLPVPPRHEKREMDFKFREFSEEAFMEEEEQPKNDEFDLKVNENDDFDV